MNTLDRINFLLVHLHLPPIGSRALQLQSRLTPDNMAVYDTWTPTHDVLDTIDRHCGIITRKSFNGSAQVGERLARLERHINAHTHPPYFHLGAEAESLAR